MVLEEVDPEPLSARDTKSFAYPTLKDRVPVIICKVIDQLYRGRNNRTDQQRDQIKAIVELLSKLRYELQTNKPLIAIEDDLPSAKVWNKYLEAETKKLQKEPKWFETTWLYAECYAYRRMVEAMQSAPDLAQEDCFEQQKKEAFYSTLNACRNLMVTADRAADGEDDLSELRFLIKMCLWGNKCDLSISSGSTAGFSADAHSSVKALEDHLVVDQSQEVIQYVDNLRKNKQGNRVLDVVMDNAGFELVSDFCLCDFLIRRGFFSQVRFRVKDCPWFVSDTMEKDIDWTLDELAKDPSLSSEPGIVATNDASVNGKVFGVVSQWRQHLKDGTWKVIVDPFWTWPHDYSLLQSAAPELYAALSEADLVLFKGDLNYRKLVSDLAWPATTSFDRALRGFHPAPVWALRTMKADVVTGLRSGQEAELQAKDSKWMLEGNWGVIQFSTKIQKSQE